MTKSEIRAKKERAALTEWQPHFVVEGEECMPPTEAYPALRTAVRELCAQFPVEYWRDLDQRRAYPEDFVAALTAAGYLGALIPREYGGQGMSLTEASVIVEEINRS